MLPLGTHRIGTVCLDATIASRRSINTPYASGISLGVELHARLIHNKDGKTFSRQPYGQPGQHIVSINRRHLNEVMITQAEKSSKVKFFFEHKVRSVDLDKKELIVTFVGGSKIPRFGSPSPSTKEADIRVKGDLVIACDGAYSAVRRSLATQPRFDYSQEYIEHGYIELNILPKNGEFALEPNVFHLWPRGHFTLIALANRDKTFTVTIFAPFSEFADKMSTPNDVDSFFKENFPDAYELLGRYHLLDTFHRVRPQSLISIKCRPHHFGDFVLLTGDAAHAMVPFYGQGMNCGFEDCLVLSEALDACNDDIRGQICSSLLVSFTVNSYTSPARKINFSEQYIRSRLVFCFKSGGLVTVFSRRINAVFGEGALTKHRAQDRSRRFRAGDFDLNVSSWSGRASGVDCSRLRQLVDSDLRQVMWGRTQVLDVHFTSIADHLRQLGKL
ncbi:hypothetical protein Y032_0934g3107 [Ancylostoma ceylanicum]|uniref:FAD-binding domain-containing protein n=1 Tax=Ancylostoma ceylanicum TaxID=53326 RepID=A0A016WAT8_9BILA|nr:hypothetical protein Y032_0934g3107 [Ancylostoma ceylanicum]